jgi:hypothetical protein
LLNQPNGLSYLAPPFQAGAREVSGEINVEIVTRPDGEGRIE